MRDVIVTHDAASPTAHYSQGVRAGDLIWTAGTVGLDPVTGKVCSNVFEDQVNAAIKHVRAVLEAGGSDLDHVIKTSCWVTNREDFLKLDGIYQQYFDTPPPARTTVVCDLVFEELLFEIEAVARIPSERTAALDV
jgi:2-iminobutanoate/2-iminopropanoate deaminase